MGGLCNECNKGGELLATGQLSNSSPNHQCTYPAHAFKNSNNLCLPLYSFVHQTTCLSFYKSHKTDFLRPVWKQIPRHLPSGPIQHTIAQLCFILWCIHVVPAHYEAKIVVMPTPQVNCNISLSLWIQLVSMPLMGLVYPKASMYNLPFFPPGTITVMLAQYYGLILCRGGIQKEANRSTMRPLHKNSICTFCLQSFLH